MRDNKRMILAALTCLLLLSTAGLVVRAQSSARFNLDWHVVGSGGGESASSNYQVNGTIGQGVASPPAVASANYIVSSGYWFVETEVTVYLPSVSQANPTTH